MKEKSSVRLVAGDLDRLRGPDQKDEGWFHIRDMDRWCGSVARYGRLVTDDEGLDIHVCDNNNGSAEPSGPELHNSRAEHVDDEFSHSSILRIILSVVGDLMMNSGHCALETQR